MLAQAAHIGFGGFALACLWSLGVSLLLGLAWQAASPGAALGAPARTALAFAWARLVRDSVANLLPFSELGAIVVGTRVLIASGLAPVRVYAGLVVDLTTEMASQLVYTLFGLALIGSVLMGHGAEGHAGQALRPAILGGTGVMIAVMLAFFLTQRAAVDFAVRLADRFVPRATAPGELRAALAQVYADKRKVAAAFGWNLAGWVASGAGAWLILILIGARLPLLDVLSLESLIFTLRSIAFVLPGAIGVQEAGYALVGPLFGLPPESALALSLAKRARDLAVSAASLAIWQLAEARAVTARG